MHSPTQRFPHLWFITGVFSSVQGGSLPRTGPGRGEWAAAWPGFLSCISVTSFVSAQLTHNHVWASQPFASDSKTPRGLYLSRHWQGRGSNTAVVTPRQKHIKSQMLTHERSHEPTATCLAWPGTPRRTVASGHPARGLSGWRAKADPLLSFIRSPEFKLHHWQGPENKISQRSLTPFIDSPSHGWLMGLEILHKLQLSRCKSVTTYRLKTKSLYLLTILVKMKDRKLAK